MALIANSMMRFELSYVVLAIRSTGSHGCSPSAVPSGSPATAAVKACLARVIRTPYWAASLAYREPSRRGSASRPAKRAYGSHEFCTTIG